MLAHFSALVLSIKILLPVRPSRENVIFDPETAEERLRPSQSGRQGSGGFWPAVVGGNHQLASLARERLHWGGIGVDQRLEQLGEDGLGRALPIPRYCEERVGTTCPQFGQQPGDDQNKVVPARKV
jgi:hypothetical protein